jgi:hypothetical protein
LKRSSEKTAEEYRVLLYGGTLEWLSSSIKSTFGKYSPSLVFEDKTIADVIFRTDSCLREAEETCVPDDNAYYEVMGNGIFAWHVCIWLHRLW